MALTIGQAKELGIEFIAKDKTSVGGIEACMENGVKLFQECRLFDQSGIIEFAWRDKSTLPEVTGGLEVELLTVNHDVIKLDLPQAIWIIQEITHWRPSLEQKACGCEKDSAELKAGTLEHAYEALDGDLCNVVNCLQNGGNGLCYDGNKNEYHRTYVTNGLSCKSGWNFVCTFKEFYEYTYTVAPVTLKGNVTVTWNSIDISDSFVDKKTESTNEKTIWTTEMVECAVELQVGMTCLYGDLEVEVIFTGDHLVMVRGEDKKEFAVSYLSLSPIETRTKESIQLDSLVEFMHENNQLTNVELAEALQENGFLKEV